MSPKHAEKGPTATKLTSGHGKHVRPIHETPIAYITDSDAWRAKMVSASIPEPATNSQHPNGVDPKPVYNSSPPQQDSIGDQPQSASEQSRQPKFWLWIFSSTWRVIHLLVAIGLGVTTVITSLISDGLLTTKADLNPDSFILPSTIAGLLAIFWLTGIILAWYHFRRQNAY